MNLKKILLATTTATLISGVAIAADDGLVVFDWSGYEDEGFFQNNQPIVSCDSNA